MKTLIVAAIVLTLIASYIFVPSLMAEPLNVGDPAPKLKTLDENGKAVDLAEELKSGYTLVYFYPKADTPGCTKQACNLRDEFTAVTDAGIKVFGVSNDNPEAQKAFKEKFKLPFVLLADKKGDVIKAFGVPTRGPGFASRQSFLVKDGKIVWRDLKAKPVTQAQDAIAAAKKNS